MNSLNKFLSLSVLTLAGGLNCALAAPVTLGGMGIAQQWTDRESTTGELPTNVWGTADTALANRIGMHVLFANGLEGTVIYNGVSGKWNTANFAGMAYESATGFFTVATGLHFLYNNTVSLPMAWVSFTMPYSNNFDLDRNNQNGSHFRASVAGWGSAVFTTYTSNEAVAAVPEPGSLALASLASLALLAVGGTLRRKA